MDEKTDGRREREREREEGGKREIGTDRWPDRERERVRESESESDGAAEAGPRATAGSEDFPRPFPHSCGRPGRGGTRGGGRLGTERGGPGQRCLQ